jgi:hypothetical protein
MLLKIWPFICIYLTGLTFSLPFSHLLEMPWKLKYAQDLYTRRHWGYGHAISAVLDFVGFGTLTASVLIDNTAARANG